MHELSTIFKPMDQVNIPAILAFVVGNLIGTFSGRIWRSIRRSISKVECEHEFIADNQITVVKCKKCGKKYWYEKGDIYAEK